MTTPDAHHTDDARAELEALERARALLCAHRDGVLHFEEHFIPTPFVTDPESGRLVIPVPEAAFFAPEHIFFVPEEADDTLQLLLSLERAEESALTDRWNVYHGEPDQVRWAECYIDAAKLKPWVFDGDALMTPNAMAGDEAWLVRSANEHKGALASLLSERLGKDVDDALCVGVDGLGLHARVRFGVVRVPFEHALTSAGEAHDAILTLLGGDAP